MTTGVVRTVFRPEEAATLTVLYGDPDNWWIYWYSLSDRLQEDGDETVADGMRFLYRIRQRPYRIIRPARGLQKAGASVWWMCTVVWKNADVRRSQSVGGSRFNNHLPYEFEYLTGSGINKMYSDVASALGAFLTSWTSFTQETRTRLWAEAETLP